MVSYSADGANRGAGGGGAARVHGAADATTGEWVAAEWAVPKFTLAGSHTSPARAQRPVWLACIARLEHAGPAALLGATPALRAARRPSLQSISRFRRRDHATTTTAVAAAIRSRAPAARQAAIEVPPRGRRGHRPGVPLGGAAGLAPSIVVIRAACAAFARPAHRQCAGHSLQADGHAPAVDVRRTPSSCACSRSSATRALRATLTGLRGRLSRTRSMRLLAHS